MTNTIGDVRGVSGTSSNLNSQPGQGTQKASAGAGTSNPGGSRPPKPADGAVPMPK
jgi:hypothetical protein